MLGGVLSADTPVGLAVTHPRVTFSKGRMA